MNFDRLLELVGEEPIFETALLLAGPVNPAAIHLQLSRWVTSGRIYQLRRGLYAIAPPYQKVKPNPFVIANRMVRASYVSCQTALAYYDLIPDIVQVTVSVTAGRPGRWETPLGVYQFHHIQQDLLRGYRMLDLGNHQQALVATPEKALLDLIYLTPGGSTPAYMNELRLQNMEQIQLENYSRGAEMFSSPRMSKTTTEISRLILEEKEGYESV